MDLIYILAGIFITAMVMSLVLAHTNGTFA